MHSLVKITRDDDGIKIEKSDQKWCLIVNSAGSPMTLCSGEVFGVGEGSAEFKQKEVAKGGITCELCKERIRFYKSIKL